MYIYIYMGKHPAPFHAKARSNAKSNSEFNAEFNAESDAESNAKSNAESNAEFTTKCNANSSVSGANWTGWMVGYAAQEAYHIVYTLNHAVSNAELQIQRRIHPTPKFGIEDHLGSHREYSPLLAASRNPKEH